MTSDPKLCGTYRVIAGGLSISSTIPGVHKRVTRPGNPLTGRYEDSEDNPTLITIEPTDEANLQMLIDNGSIVPYTPPRKRQRSSPQAGGTNGQARRV